MSPANGALRAAQPKGAHTPWLDRLSIGASFACLVHCLLLPVAIGATPALAQLFGASEQFHLWVLAAAVPISALAIARGFKRHGLWLPVILAVAGLTLLGSGALIGLPRLIETGLTLAGSVLLAIAHLQNSRPRIVRLRQHSPEAAMLIERSGN